jgi:curved DNA-binding protein CbpA
VSFEEARRAYYAAISKEHPDRGGSVEQAKCINAAWERIKRHYGRR